MGYNLEKDNIVKKGIDMKDHKQILTDSIKAHEAAISKAKSEIAELDKPKLRHGDYGARNSDCEVGGPNVGCDGWIKLKDRFFG